MRIPSLGKKKKKKKKKKGNEKKERIGVCNLKKKKNKANIS